MLPQIMKLHGKFQKIIYTALEREKPLVESSILTLKKTFIYDENQRVKFKIYKIKILLFCILDVLL